MKRYVVAALALALGGCANLFAVHHGEDVSGNETFFIDAEQRAIVSGNYEADRVVCAEPSPDSISALAHAGSGAFSNDAINEVRAAFAQSESAAYVGLRTPTIQLLRDGMYRLCEGYMNGAVTSDHYVVLLNRYQEMMVGLVAIEQLTGVVRAPSVAIHSGAAEASVQANLASAARADRDRYTAELAAIDREIERLKGRTPPTEDPQKTAYETRLSNLTWRQENLRSAVAAQQAAVAALTPDAAGENSAEAGQGGDTLEDLPDHTGAEDVAASVDEITRRITLGNFVMMFCFPELWRNAGLTAQESTSTPVSDGGAKQGTLQRTPRQSALTSAESEMCPELIRAMALSQRPNGGDEQPDPAPAPAADRPPATNRTSRNPQ